MMHIPHIAVGIEISDPYQPPVEERLSLDDRG